MKQYGLFTRNTVTEKGLYRYMTAVDREDTISALVDNSSLARQKHETYWRKMRRYYDGTHDIALFSGGFAEEMNLPWIPAQSSDGYIHIESQIEPTPPAFEFSVRSEKGTDSAKMREETVRRVCEYGELAAKNTLNERRLGIYGSAVWKIGWGECTYAGKKDADITIEAPLPEQIYIDPAALSVDDAEYIAFVYRIHRQKAYRVFADDLKRRGEHFDEYLHAPGKGVVCEGAFDEDDTVCITEFWFRQPSDGKCEGIPIHAGDIALCVLINGKEIRYIPKYWQKTACDMYPFVIYNKIPTEGSVWGKSELEVLIPLIDAADRDLTFAQLNAAFHSNDVILAEENAFSDGEVPENAPGAVWKLRPGMMGKVKRLGNLGASQNAQFASYAMWQSMMEQTTGNFEVNQGKEPTHVTTASGIALMNERAKSRKSLKSCGRTEGFRRLYMLIDCTALEFYTPGRFVDAACGTFAYTPKKTDGKLYPAVDIKIHLGDGVTNSKAFTVSALSALAGMHIDADNYKLVEAYVEALGLPMRAEICEYLDKRFGKASDLDKLFESPSISALLGHEERKTSSEVATGA